ncbi:MAG: trypsin-like peptidase domain-containing protein [Candidatus Sumerlaeia bacterium]|nr:trypsin-like peptidase domain-containing protein [Candidatus Sumerlaeia bacterium]
MLLMKTRETVTMVLVGAVLAVAPMALDAQSASRELDSRAFIEVADRVLPAVVNISIEPKTRRWSTNPEDYDDPLDMFRRPISVSGSGVVVRVNGEQAYVLTNHHVVDRHDDRTNMTLTFHRKPAGSTEYTETTEVTGEGVIVLGSDEMSDLAVIQFTIPEGLEVKPIGFADSDKVEIGEHVVALGNPLDLNHTISQGIVSAKARYLGAHISMERLIQTDATIQQGSSGGPLVNLDGNIIGINNAIASRNGMWQGIGFAIPSNDAQRISNQLIDYQRVVRGYLGVNMAHVATKREILPYLQLDRAEGVFIENVVSNSPADVAGLHIGDVIVAIDGYPVRSPDEMLRTITSKPVNVDVKI